MRYLVLVGLRIMKVGFKVTGKEISSAGGIMMHREAYIHEVYSIFSIF